MNQDDQLPPEPTHIKPRVLKADEQGLPPLSPRSLVDVSARSDLEDLQSDQMGRSSLSRFFDRLRPSASWTPLKLILVLFICSFIFSILFTSAILAGFIEIHPGAIKSFLKALVGKS